MFKTALSYAIIVLMAVCCLAGATSLRGLDGKIDTREVLEQGPLHEELNGTEDNQEEVGQKWNPPNTLTNHRGLGWREQQRHQRNQRKQNNNRNRNNIKWKTQRCAHWCRNHKTNWCVINRKGEKKGKCKFSSCSGCTRCTEDPCAGVPHPQAPPPNVACPHNNALQFFDDDATTNDRWDCSCCYYEDWHYSSKSKYEGGCCVVAGEGPPTPIKG